MKPAPFQYVRPASIADAVGALVGSAGGGKVIAGGQSLVPVLNFRLSRLSLLVDIGLLTELSVLCLEDRTLVIGAGVRQRIAEISPLVKEHCPLIAQALRHVGHVQIRNRGTVGGSIAHADPAGELPAVALALNAEIVACGPRGERTIVASDFFLGPYMTALADEEIVTHIRFPVIDNQRTRFLEYARRAGDFALAGVAITVRVAPTAPCVASAGIAAMGIDGSPVRLHETEAYLQGRELRGDVPVRAGSIAASEIDPPSDIKADGLYRKELLSTLLSRGLKELAA